MKRGRQGDGGGRPPVPQEFVEAAFALMDEEGITAEEAAERIGIGGNTVRRALARRAADSDDADDAPRSPRSPAPEMALIKRILKARAPAALEELEEGLLIAGIGESELLRWLARPLPRSDEAPDPYLATIDALNTACTFVERLAPTDRRAATILNSLSNLAKAAENIAAKRPRPETPDEVADRIRARRDDAVSMITQYTHEAEARIQTVRAEIAEWAAGIFGPVLSKDLDARIGRLLGEESDA